MDKKIFRLPDNWHAHLRQAALMLAIYFHFNIYGRVMCMGNTTPLIETGMDALMYEAEILDLKPLFEPVMCIMLTEDTTPEIIIDAFVKGIRFVKYIPGGTSYGAVKGVSMLDFPKLHIIFGIIQELGMHLLIHAEMMFDEHGKEVKLIDREEVAINHVSMYHKFFPKMKITFEHASTERAINFIKKDESGNRRATLTPQNALLTYSDVFADNGRMINPLNSCLPVLKREPDRKAIEQEMISGDERFFAGTDAAAHLAKFKEGVNPPPGIILGHAEYPLYLKVFDRNGVINKSEDFTSRFGAEYYGYPLNEETITVVREEWKQPVGKNGVNYCMGGETIGWKIIERNGVPILLN